MFHFGSERQEEVKVEDEERLNIAHTRGVVISGKVSGFGNW